MFVVDTSRVRVAERVSDSVFVAVLSSVLVCLDLVAEGDVVNHDVCEYERVMLSVLVFVED